eukprot:TRINITY_DN5344_c0_g1_i5.p1 TRINITY_DN5344_c0_g1~~TRINITY_DN5344_c0_g1_i5.p1  ORF type:complete len:247 (+),score=53.41 TRINITY_DN5344_c0_g1_i5:129-869(+)
MTLPILKDLETAGRKFMNSDEMIPAVKKFSGNDLGFFDWDDIPTDLEGLMDYLSSPETVLLDKVEDLEDSDLRDLLYVGNGLENTIDLLEYHNKDGTRYEAVPDLTASTETARPKRRRVKNRMMDIINEPTGLLTSGKPINNKDTEDVYREAFGGPQSAAIVRALADDGKSFDDLASLAVGVATEHKRKKKRELAGKARSSDYLKRPGCPCFAAPGVKEKDVTYGEEIGRAVQQECRDRSRMPSSA